MLREAKDKMCRTPHTLNLHRTMPLPRGCSFVVDETDDTEKITSKINYQS